MAFFNDPAVWVARKTKGLFLADVAGSPDYFDVFVQYGIAGPDGGAIGTVNGQVAGSATVYPVVFTAAGAFVNKYISQASAAASYIPDPNHVAANIVSPFIGRLCKGGTGGGSALGSFTLGGFCTRLQIFYNALFANPFNVNANGIAFPATPQNFPFAGGGLNYISGSLDIRPDFVNDDGFIHDITGSTAVPASANDFQIYRLRVWVTYNYV